jgi:hypothetical protein
VSDRNGNGVESLYYSICVVELEIPRVVPGTFSGIAN